MAAVLIPATRIGTWSAGNVFYQGAFCAPRESNTSEALSQSRLRAAGTISNLWFRISSNSCSAASTFKSRIAGANGNISISVNASTSGTFEDASNTDVIAADALVDFDFTAGAGTGSFLLRSYAFVFNADSNTVFRTGNTGVGLNGASFTGYFNLIGGGATATTVENETQQEVPAAGTLKNMFVYVSGNARTTTTTIKTRVNGADGNVTVSIVAAATGIFEDTSNTDTISAGDEINGKYTTGTGTEVITVAFVAVSLETTTGQSVVGSGMDTPGGVVVTTGTTRYWGLGAGGNVDTTESDASVKALLARTVSKLWAGVVANATTSASTLDFRVNSASSALTVSITAGTTGEFSDATNSVAIVATDVINVRVVNGGGGSLGISHWTMLASAAIRARAYMVSQAVNRAATY